MKKVLIIAVVICLVMAVFCGYMSWRLKREIVIPIGVSYAFSAFRVDQVMTAVEGDFSQKEWHDAKYGYSQKIIDNESVKTDKSNLHTSKVTTEIGVDSNFSISSIVAGGLSAIDPHVRVGADRNGELIRKKTDSEHTDKSTQAERTESEGGDSRYEKNIKGTLGDYYLHFTLTLKNNDLDDRYIIKAKDHEVKVLIRSVALKPAFEIPVSIPNIDGREVRCGETIIPVSVRISGTRNLEQLIDCQRSGILSEKLSGVIVPQDFPLLSIRTGRNIFAVMAENEISVPTTEIVLDFGDAGRLSPWRVRRNREPQYLIFGERTPVSICEALKGINAKIASSGSFNSGTFRIDGNGILKSVAGVPSGQIDSKKGALLGAEFDGEMRYEALGRECMDEELGNYNRIRFVKVDVRSIVSKEPLRNKY